jgi:rhodanese-related sulfurtransferase
VPANLKCGRPETDPDSAADPSWAPLKFTFAGIWEIDPLGLEEHAAQVQILDVREPGEFDGPLGHIRGATLIPLGELAARAGELARDRPIVAVCRAGFGDVANLAGGMLRWRAEGHAVEGGSA